MSLVHRRRALHNGPMTSPNRPNSFNSIPRSSSHSSSAKIQHRASFSAETYRRAMGPGYAVALFKEQAELTDHAPAFKRPIAVRAPARRPKTRRFRRTPYRLPRLAMLRTAW